MAELTAADHKIRKAVGEAEKSLAKLYREIQPTNFNIKIEKLDKKKILAAHKKVLAFMNKFTPITRIQGSGLYDQLTPSSQQYVTWMDGVMGRLLSLAGDLKKAAKLADKDPMKDLKILISTSRQHRAKLRSAPQGVGTLVKQIEKDFGPDSPGFSGVSIIPALLMLFLIAETIANWFKQRPKLKD